MTAIINVTYDVLVTKQETRKYSTILDIIDDFRAYALKYYFIHDEEDLKDVFTSYVDDNLEVPLEKNEEFDEDLTIEILNWENEIRPLLLDLITVKKSPTCCSSFSRYDGYKYCPTCGERL